MRIGWGTRKWRLCASNGCQYHPIPPNTTPIPPSNECQYHPQGRPPHANGSVPMPHPRWGRCLLRTHITYTQRSASDRALVFLLRGFCLPGTARSLELNTPEGVSGSRRPTALQTPPSNVGKLPSLIDSNIPLLNCFWGSGTEASSCWTGRGSACRTEHGCFCACF